MKIIINKNMDKAASYIDTVKEGQQQESIKPQIDPLKRALAKLEGLLDQLHD